MTTFFKGWIGAPVLALVLALSAPAGWATDLAVIISNTDYRNYPRVPDGQRITGLETRFREAGFDTIVLTDLSRSRNRMAQQNVWDRMWSAERLVVVAQGYVVRSRSDNWLLNVGADTPNLLNVGQVGLSLGAVQDLLARRPGQSLLAVADQSYDGDLALGLRDRFSPRNIGQGVAVVSGSPRQIATFIRGTVLQPGKTLRSGVGDRASGVTGHGYLPRREAFTVAAPVVQPEVDQNAAERAFWRQTQGINTLAAYRAYLQRYPNGQFRQAAQNRVNDLTLTPQDRARLAEEALGLNRDQRRAIQRHLTLLGYDTRGVDGVLGNNSRRAIGAWQRDAGIPASGYLNANQISRISASAAVRAEELRREAERRRAQQERRDRNFWNQTGASGQESGYRTYLEQFPDGIFADEAKQALAAIERQRRREAQREEREAWDNAVMAGTIQSYRAYLEAYPEGRFVQEARARVRSLSEPETPQDLIDAAKQEENRMGLNPFTRKLIEGQLRRLNLDPGPVDGQFTNKTRRALRQYQRANSIVVTGFVTRETVVRLLASAN